MPRNDLARLFEQLDTISLGFGPAFRDFTLQTQSYPPHNIIHNGENSYVIEVAVAGFKKNEISIQEHQGSLSIKGTKESSNDSASDVYQFRGIGRRSFEKSFKLAEYVEVIDAALEDGILSVYLERKVPETEQPKLIAIK